MLLAFGAVLIVMGVYPVSAVLMLTARVWPVLLFVVAVTVMAELATRSGLFDVLADAAARVARGRGMLLWLLVAVIAVAATVFLSLDTTAVLLTPIVVVLARRVSMDPLPFAFTTVWMANTASMLLPVSNLTNLLAQQRLGGVSPGDFAALTFGAEIAGVLVPLAVLLAVFRRRIVRRYQEASTRTEATRDRALLVIVALMVVAFIIGILSGLPVWQPACAAAALMIIAFAWRRREALRFNLLPIPVVVLCCGMFLSVGALGALGLSGLLEHLVPAGSGLGATLATAGLGAASANLVNNLPAYLALEPAEHGSGAIVALLIGVNIGPLVTPWASLATLLWYERLRRLDVVISWRRYALLGLVAAPLTGTLAVLATNTVR